MSGKINSFKQLNGSDEFEINVDFIEPDYFQNELIIGNSFTIREASKILGEGKVNE